MVNKGDRYALLTFDTESDIGSWTQDYTSISKALPLIDDVLQSRKIRGTFFWEGMAAMHGPDMVRRIFEAGHEIGAHGFKHETLGEVTHFIPGDRAILPEEVPNRIRRNAQILTELTGERPVSFRAPRLWGSGELNRVLEDEGFVLDSSYPVHSPSDSLFPYHPDHGDWAREGNSKILEAPVVGVYGEMMDTLDNRIMEYGAELAMGKEVQSIGQWPILRLFGAQAFMGLLEPFIAEQMTQRGFSVLCIYLHPWEFIPMPAVLTGIEARVELSRMLHENCGDKTLTALDELIGMLQGNGYKFLTARELHGLWEG